MYINKIDELMDKIIDDFYNNIITNKEFTKINNEINFVKYQLNINKILANYASQINRKEIFNIVNDEDNTNTVIELFKKYIAYYFFLTIGFNYTGKYETFINNIIEFTKNQAGFELKITNFFNSDSNSNIIKYYTLVKNMLTVLNADSIKLATLVKNKNFTESISFLNELGQEFVNTAFKLENLGGKLTTQAHNMIKTIIINEIYIKRDKEDIYQILDKTEKTAGEFIFIDIVVPKMEYIDYSTIELSLPQSDVDSGLAAEIYDLITQYDVFVKTKDMSTDDKILELLNRKFVVPITEDFLLYHKDSEKYEKKGISDTESAYDKKKKEDTRIKYIINKIDSASEYFSKNIKNDTDLRKNIEKLFYVPLSDRRVVTINHYEDLRIVDKLQKQGKKAIETSEYYNELVTYMQYPYVSFKDFQQYGMNISLTHTIDAARSTIFEKHAAGTQQKYLQLRVGGANQSINIVGFIVPNNKLSLHCIKGKNLIDIRKVGYNVKGQTKKISNGYEGTLKFIKRSLINPHKELPGIYWMFDLENDKVTLESYNITSNLNINEQVKLLTSKLYDDILVVVYNNIIRKIENKKDITINYFYKLIKYYNKFIDIPYESDIYNQLESKLFRDFLTNLVDKYDKQQDAFPGLFGEVIKLPNAPEVKKDKIPSVIIRKQFADSKLIKKITKKEDEDEETAIITAVCQHFVTWDNISAIRKKNPNQFAKLLFEFMFQYIIQNHEDDFICKSCGSLVNIKNYVLDGAYDEGGSFISFSMTMDVPLEDIFEYEKYKPSIRNIEKLTEKVAYVANINSLVGKSSTIKSRIRRIVKDTIDLILLHNVNLKNIYKERNNKISAYGLSKELSNLFVFDLDNSIFIFSTKDKDFYKPIKRNNILTYIVFLILLELSENQLLYMSNDKICNYYMYEKYGRAWFNDIYIRKNNQASIVPILNYEVLCYLIFYISCLLTKYNMWHTNIASTKATAGEDVTEPTEKKKKFDPNIQKAIIHTLVDFLNSIIEMYSKKKKHYMYDMIANKFFQKLNTMFNNEELLNKIKEIEKKKITTVAKSKLIASKAPNIILAGEFNHADYIEESQWMKCKITKKFLKQRKLNQHDKVYNISNVTNCESGTFHMWSQATNVDKTCTCKICKITTSQIDKSDKMTEKIQNNYKVLELQKISKKYCSSGILHNFVYDTNSKCSICMKCKHKESDTYDKTEIVELEKNIRKVNEYLKDKANYKEPMLDIELKGDKGKKQTDIINDIKSSYGKSKEHKEDFYHFIDTFISLLESIIGHNININSANVYLREDTYIFDHDHNGYSIYKPITIIDDGSKFLLKKNHPFFKKDVMFYTNNKLQIDIFYDPINQLLLGYKERNKDFQLPKKSNIYIKINRSIANRLKYLGYPSKFINIADANKEIQHIYKVQDNPQFIIKNIVGDISRTRIDNLKKSLSDIQRYIYRIAYSFDVPIIEKDDFINTNKFLDKYKSKLNNMKLKSKTNKDDKNNENKNKENKNKENKSDRFLSKWKVIKNNIFFESLNTKIVNLDPSVNFLEASEISTYDYSGNLILFYIINEFTQLINYNDDKYIKINLVYFILDIINKIYDNFNMEQNIMNTEIKRFSYILSGMEYAEQVNEMSTETEGLYDEVVDAEEPVDENVIEELKDKKEDDEGEFETMDMEEEHDYEIDYQDGVNLNM